MPVFTVLESTWSQPGFSTKRSTRPAASVTTMPYSGAPSQRFRAMVATLLLAR